MSKAQIKTYGPVPDPLRRFYERFNPGEFDRAELSAEAIDERKEKETDDDND